MIGIMVASTSCHTASILIPWNSLLPVSTIIYWVAACIFPFSVSIWASRFPLLFIIFPRYLYAGTSSSITPFRLICVFGPLPIFTILHLGAPNSMWFFRAIWLVTSSIFCASLAFSCIRRTSSIHSRSLSFSPFINSSPMSFLLISLVISSFRVAYSMTDSTPPCRILSLIVIFLVSPYLVCICAVSPVFSFLIISSFFFPTPFLYNAYRMASSQALS